MNIREHIIANDVLRQVNDILESQTAKGLAKYGVTVNPDDYTVTQWIDHVREELVDSLVYLTVLKIKLEEQQND